MPMASEYRDAGASQPIKNVGVYYLSPVHIVPNAATKDGAPMVKVVWETDQGESVWDNLAIVKGAAFRWGQLWFGLGEDDYDFPTVDDLARACLKKLQVGIQVYAKIKLELYNGISGPKVDCYLSPDEGITMLGVSEQPLDEEVPF